MTILTKRIGYGVAAIAVLLTFSGEASAQAQRKLVFANDCKRPIQLWVYHSPTRGNYQPHGWYKFDAWDSYSYVRTGGTPLMHLEGEPLYFYAETTDGGTVQRWQGGSISATYQGGTFQMTKANTFVDDNGDIGTRITCP